MSTLRIATKKTETELIVASKGREATQVNPQGQLLQRWKKMKHIGRREGERPGTATTAQGPPPPHRPRCSRLWGPGRKWALRGHFLFRRSGRKGGSWADRAGFSAYPGSVTPAGRGCPCPPGPCDPRAGSLPQGGFPRGQPHSRAVTQTWRTPGRPAEVREPCRPPLPRKPAETAALGSAGKKQPADPDFIILALPSNI